MFTVIHKRKSRTNLYPAQDVGKSRRPLFLYGMLLIGLILGALAVRHGQEPVLDKLLTLIRNYLQVKQEQPLWINLNNAFLKRLLSTLIIYCIGLCAVGAPMLYLIPVMHGAGVGMVSAYLYAAFALKGIGYCALILYPGEILFAAAMLFGCTAGMEMSGRLLRQITGNTDLQDAGLRQYSAQFGVILLICAASAILETAMYVLFSGYFQFS